MRLINYLSYSGFDESTNIFRALSIKLVDTKTKYDEIISYINEKYNIDSQIIIDDLNKELKTIYGGKYKFDFCLNEGCELSDIKINERLITKIKMNYFEANDKFAKIKNEIEKNIKN